MKFANTSKRDRVCIQLFWERLSEEMCTRQSRKGYDQYTVPDTVAVEPTFVFAFLSTRKQTSMASRAIPSNFFEEQGTQNHPQYISGLSRALFPTTFLEIAVFYQNGTTRLYIIAH